MRYTLRSGNPSEAEITFYGNVRQAINCKDPELILSGPRDTGKTLGLLYKLHCLAWKYPRASIVIARKRATDLTSTVVQTYRYKVLRPDEPIRIYGGESPSWFDYPNGSRIWLAGLDKPGKVLSAEHDIIYVNQAEEISLIDWLALLGSATGRAGHIPYAQVIGDCNPSSPTHWIRTRAKSPSNPDGALTLIESSHRDNPDLYDQKTGLMTEKGEQRLGRLRSLTGHLLQRWYYGMWVAPEGAIYSVFDEARHKVRAFPIPPLWPRFVGIDPIGAYVAAVWVALDPTNGVLNVYREYYEPFGIPTNQHAANILRHSGYQPNGRPLTALAAEPIHYWVVGQPAERQARADWTASGIPASCPAFSDLWMGIDRVNALLSENSLVIHDSCPMLLNEIGDYRRTLKDGVPTESIENKEVYHCLTGDTMVTTDRGNIPIRDIAPDSKVLTRAGYRRVLGSACTNPAANVYKVTFSDGTALTGTAEHLIWTKGRGYVALHSLRYSDTMLTSDEVRGRCKARKSRMMATSGIDTTQPQKGARTDCTSRALSMGSSPTSIVTYGKSTMGQFQWVTLYTTSTATPVNNAPDNLQAVTVEQHIREHWSEERSEAARQHASEIRVLASEWHRSPEGREWHRLHGKRAWANRKPIALICEQCGNGFETTKYTNARFCSNRCKAAWRRAAGIDDEFRTCPYCGERFSVNRYSKQRFCSRLCAQRHRFAPERACLQP